jgi:anti-anti-sigma factor
MSATLAAADGTILVTVSRHIESPSAGSPPGTGPLVVVAVAGDLDHDTCDLLGMALHSAIDAGGRVCCDLTRVDLLAAAGVNTLLDAHHRAERRGRRLIVRGALGIARRVLQITGADTVLTIER